MDTLIKVCKRSVRTLEIHFFVQIFEETKLALKSIVFEVYENRRIRIECMRMRQP